jgi:hypothetical protein
MSFSFASSRGVGFFADIFFVRREKLLYLTTKERASTSLSSSLIESIDIRGREEVLKDLSNVRSAEMLDGQFF